MFNHSGIEGSSTASSRRASDVFLDRHHAAYLERIDDLENSIETLWTAISIVLVFAMQIGFALLEAGSVRTMNRKSTLLKNVIDVSVTIIAWVVCGGYIVHGWYGYGNPEENSLVSARGLFDLMFACSTATIISGAVTERISILAYIVMTVVVSGLIYPVVVLWVWTDNGFLKKLGYVDFAGSSVVHAVGGVVGIVCAWRLGPRRYGIPEEWALPPQEIDEASSPPSAASATGSTTSKRSRRRGQRSESKESCSQSTRNARLEKLVQVLEKRVKFIERSHYGTTRSAPITWFSRFERPDLDVKEFQGNSPAFVVIGTFMLWYGFYGFNAGSANISGQSASVVVRVMWNTTMSATGGQCAALLLNIRARLRPNFKVWFVMDPNIVMSMCNATIAGLVSACAGSDRESGFNAFITGAVGAMLHSWISTTLVFCGIDDPVDAGAVHLGGGAAGTLLCGLLPQPEEQKARIEALTGRSPVFPIQLVGMVTIVSWSALGALLVAECLKRLNVLRVPSALEAVGFDVWLQQSFLPPPAPDVLTQLPDFKKRGSNPWKVSSGKASPSKNSIVDELFELHDLCKAGAVIESSSENESERVPMPAVQDSTASSSRLHSESSGSPDLQSLDRGDHGGKNLNADMEYALYQESLQEQYEKELMAMCGFSQEGDVESVRSQDAGYESSFSERLSVTGSFQTARERAGDDGIITSV